jgi:hypothetical protein
VVFRLVRCKGGFVLPICGAQCLISTRSSGSAVAVLYGHASDEIVLIRDFGFFHGYSGLTVLILNRRF